MKINFKKIETKISFEGDVQTFDIAKRIANAMKYQTTVLMDIGCLLYTSPSPRDRQKSRMPSSA